MKYCINEISFLNAFTCSQIYHQLSFNQHFPKLLVREIEQEKLNSKTERSYAELAQRHVYHIQWQTLELVVQSLPLNISPHFPLQYFAQCSALIHMHVRKLSQLFIDGT